jgi:flagellar motor switch protein FliN/FliY
MSNDDNSSEGPSPVARLAVLRSMPIEVQVRFGQAFLTLKEVLNLEQGSMIELTKLASEPPLELMLNGRVLGRGMAVATGDQLGVQITELVPADEELPRLPEFLEPRQGDPVPFKVAKASAPPPVSRFASGNPPPDHRPAPLPDEEEILDSDQHPMARALARTAARAASLKSVPELTSMLPRLELFVEPLNSVLFGQPASHFTTTGDVLELHSVGEWADAFLKDWLDELCAWFGDCVVGGRDLEEGPVTIAGLLGQLQEEVLSPLAEHLYVEVILVLKPARVDPQRMQIVARLPTGGTTACAARVPGLVVGQRVIRQAGVVVG